MVGWGDRCRADPGPRAAGGSAARIGLPLNGPVRAQEPASRADAEPGSGGPAGSHRNDLTCVCPPKDSRAPAPRRQAGTSSPGPPSRSEGNPRGLRVAGPGVRRRDRVVLQGREGRPFRRLRPLWSLSGHAPSRAKAASSPDAAPGTALVLADRSLQVQRAFDGAYAKVTRSHTTADPRGWHAGYAARPAANQGGTGVSSGASRALAGGR